MRYIFSPLPLSSKIMATPKRLNAQEKKDADTTTLKEEYQSLMDAFLKLHTEAHSMVIGKGDENAYFKSLVNFAKLVREASPIKTKVNTEMLHTNGAAIHSNGV